MLELLPVIPENKECKSSYDMQTFLTDKPRHMIATNKYNYKNLYQNAIIMESLMNEALKINNY